MWTQIGATVKTLTPQQHDEVLSFTSHLPHVLAFSLMKSIPEDHLQHAPKSLKDSTRIAASSPQMWSDICMANSKNVLNALDQCVEQLASFRKAIVSHDQKNLLQYFTKAQEKRNKLK